MRIAVVSCAKYVDCWLPFFACFRKFWPTCKYPIFLITDTIPTDYRFASEAFNDVWLRVYGPEMPWSRTVARFASETNGETIVFQDDFWLNAPVNELLIEKGIEQLRERNAAMVRLYPCPGGDIPYGNNWYAEIPKGTPYRVSCQLSAWRNVALYRIASQCDSPADFEIKGSKLSNDFAEPFIAFRRDQQPYPVSYFCSAVSRGQFNPQAVEFCRQEEIPLDLSMRPIQAA